MNLFSIALKSIRQRALASSLTALSVALGVMLMVSVLVIHGIIEQMFSQRSIGYNLIVGPKGSEMDLVLSTVYRVVPPIENLPYKYYLQIKDDPRVEHAIPFAFGDVTEEGAFPIVGTTTEYFILDYAPGKSGGPGRKFQIRGRQLSRPFDAIIGSRVARDNDWDIGSTFKLVHGGAESDHVHDEVFTVCAVLAPTGTPNDKTVFVSLDGFFQIAGHEKPLDEAVKRWMEFNGEQPTPEAIAAEVAALKKKYHIHEDEHDHSQHDHAHHHHHAVPDEQKEVTSILLKTKSITAGLYLESDVNEGFKAQAVNPIIPMARLMNSIVGNIRTVLLILVSLIIVVSGVSIFVSIYNSMADRRREIAIMRALGARRQTVFSIILLESIMLCFGGGLLGIALGHGLVFLAAPIVEARSGLIIDPFAFERVELVLLPILIALASLVGFVPGMTAYRTDVAKALAE